MDMRPGDCSCSTPPRSTVITDRGGTLSLRLRDLKSREIVLPDCHHRQWG